MSVKSKKNSKQRLRTLEVSNTEEVSQSRSLSLNEQVEVLRNVQMNQHVAVSSSIQQVQAERKAEKMSNDKVIAELLGRVKSLETKVG